MKTLGINFINYKLVQREWLKWLKKNGREERVKLREIYRPKYRQIAFNKFGQKVAFNKMIPLMEKKDLINLYISILENNKK